MPCALQYTYSHVWDVRPFNEQQSKDEKKHFYINEHRIPKHYAIRLSHVLRQIDWIVAAGTALNILSVHLFGKQTKM